MEITPSGTSLERRTAWIQIRPDILWSLNWVKTVQLNRFLQAKQSTQVQITKSLCINGDDSIGDITRASKGLDPDHARHFMEPELGPNRSAESFLASKNNQRIKVNLILFYFYNIALVRWPPCELNISVLQQQQNLGRRFGASEMHLSPPVA